MSDMDRKIQEIIDKESIRDLVHMYCRAADRHDHDLMRELYHEDAYDDHGPFLKERPWNSLICCLRFKNLWGFCITMSLHITSI